MTSRGPHLVMRRKGHGKEGRKPRVYVDLGVYTNLGAFCIARIQQKGAREAIENALEKGNAKRLRAALKSPGGKWISRSWDEPPSRAARDGNLECLRVLKECGFALRKGVLHDAARWGHIDCLKFAMNHIKNDYKFKLSDDLVVAAVWSGSLACVEFLLQQGLPHKTCVLDVSPVNPDRLKCVQFMLDKGVAIDPQTLILAASCGDLDFVRFLHERGMPLWRAAHTHVTQTWYTAHALNQERKIGWGRALPSGTIVIPSDPRAFEKMWKALRYGAMHGAPVSTAVQQLFEEKRERTRALLYCFKAAARLCTGPGPAEQRRLWAGMAALPPARVEKLLIFADLEVPDSVPRRLPPEAPAVAPVRKTAWGLRVTWGSFFAGGLLGAAVCFVALTFAK